MQHARRRFTFHSVNHEAQAGVVDLKAALWGLVIAVGSSDHVHDERVFLACQRAISVLKKGRQIVSSESPG